MKFSQLQPAANYEVEKWLETSIRNLTDDQKRWIYNEEIVRFSPFQFYKRVKKEKPTILWRLSALFYPIYLILLILFNPIKWIFTGEWGYGEKFLDGFHYKWTRKIGF